MTRKLRFRTDGMPPAANDKQLAVQSGDGSGAALRSRKLLLARNLTRHAAARDFEKAANDNRAAAMPSEENRPYPRRDEVIMGRSVGLLAWNWSEPTGLVKSGLPPMIVPAAMLVQGHACCLGWAGGA